MIADDPNDGIDFAVEFLHVQCPSGRPPHLLKLKVGAFNIYVLRNLNPKRIIKRNSIDSQESALCIEIVSKRK